MLMTREMDYALRILRALHREEQLSAAEIAQRESIPKAITVKILKKLHTCSRPWARRSWSTAASGLATSARRVRRTAAASAGS